MFSDDLIEKLHKQIEDMKLNSIRKVKEVEHISEEKDRKLRILEQKSDKMREKLEQLTKKDRSSANKKAETLKSYQRGAEVVVSSPSSTLKTSKKATARSPGGDDSVSVDDVLQAMEEEQQTLCLRNEELEKQVFSLTKRLKKSMNSNSLSMSKPDMTDTQNHKSNHSELPSSSSIHDTSNNEVVSDDDVQILSDKVKEQSQRIRQLVHQLEAETATVKKQNADMKILRQRGGEMREEIHNLRLEIDSRPTMSQWNSKVSRDEHPACRLSYRYTTLLLPLCPKTIRISCSLSLTPYPVFCIP